MVSVSVGGQKKLLHQPVAISVKLGPTVLKTFGRKSQLSLCVEGSGAKEDKNTRHSRDSTCVLGPLVEQLPESRALGIN